MTPLLVERDGKKATKTLLFVHPTRNKSIFNVDDVCVRIALHEF